MERITLSAKNFTQNNAHRLLHVVGVDRDLEVGPEAFQIVGVDLRDRLVLQEKVVGPDAHDAVDLAGEHKSAGCCSGSRIDDQTLERLLQRHHFELFRPIPRRVGFHQSRGVVPVPALALVIQPGRATSADERQHFLQIPPLMPRLETFMDHFGVSRMAALFRLRNLKMTTQAEFELLKTAEDMGRGRGLAGLLTLRDTYELEDKNGFRHRVLNLALEAYRRDQITRAKLGELATLLSVREEEVDQVLERAGLSGGEPTDVLIPGE